MADYKLASEKSAWALLGETKGSPSKMLTYSTDLSNYKNDTHHLELTTTGDAKRLVRLQYLTTVASITDRNFTLNISGTWETTTSKFTEISFSLDETIKLEGGGTIGAKALAAPIAIVVKWGDNKTLTISSGAPSTLVNSSGGYANFTGYKDGTYTNCSGNIPSTKDALTNVTVASITSGSTRYNFATSKTIDETTTITNHEMVLVVNGTWNETTEKFTSITFQLNEKITDGIRESYKTGVAAPADLTVHWLISTEGSSYATTTIPQKSAVLPTNSYYNGSRWIGCSGPVPSSLVMLDSVSVDDLTVGADKYTFTTRTSVTTVTSSISATGELTPGIGASSGDLQGTVKFSSALTADANVSFKLRARDTSGASVAVSGTITATIPSGSTSFTFATSKLTNATSIKLSDLTSENVIVYIEGFSFGYTGKETLVDNTTKNTAGASASRPKFSLYGRFASQSFHSSNATIFDWDLTATTEMESNGSVIVGEDVDEQMQVKIAIEVEACDALGIPLGVIATPVMTYTYFPSGAYMGITDQSFTAYSGNVPYNRVFTQPNNVVVTAIRVTGISAFDADDNPVNAIFNNNIESFEYTPLDARQPFEIVLPIDSSDMSGNALVTIAPADGGATYPFSFAIPLDGLGKSTGMYDLVCGVCVEVWAMNGWFKGPDYDTLTGQQNYILSKYIGQPTPAYSVLNVDFTDEDICLVGYGINDPINHITPTADSTNNLFYLSRTLYNKKVGEEAYLAPTGGGQYTSAIFYDLWHEGSAQVYTEQTLGLIKTNYGATGSIPDIKPGTSRTYWQDASYNATNVLSLYICKEPAIEMNIECGVAISDWYEDPYYMRIQLTEALSTFIGDDGISLEVPCHTFYSYDSANKTVRYNSGVEKLSLGLDPYYLGDNMGEYNVSTETNYVWALDLGTPDSGYTVASKPPFLSKMVEYNTGELGGNLVGTIAYINDASGYTTYANLNSDSTKLIKVRIKNATTTNAVSGVSKFEYVNSNPTTLVGNQTTCNISDNTGHGFTGAGMQVRLDNEDTSKGTNVLTVLSLGHAIPFRMYYNGDEVYFDDDNAMSITASNTLTADDDSTGYIQLNLFADKQSLTRTFLWIAGLPQYESVEGAHTTPNNNFVIEQSAWNSEDGSHVVRFRGINVNDLVGLNINIVTSVEDMSLQD